jgi:hypothetical protein
MNGKRPQAMPYGSPQEQQQADRAVADENHPAKRMTSPRLYGVTVSVGKAYKSRVEQGESELGELFQAEPQLFNILGDIYLKFADFPGHREAAERVKRMLPPQARDPEGENDPRVELEQAKAMLQQMEAKMKELEPERMKAQVQIETAKAKSGADVQIAQFKGTADVAIARMNNAAKIRVAEITATKETVFEARDDETEAIALGMEHAHAAAEAEKDRAHERAGRQHEAAMAAAGVGAQAGEAERGRQHEADMGDVGHEQALEQADQANEAAMAQQQQAAELAPQPEAGA